MLSFPDDNDAKDRVMPTTMSRSDKPSLLIVDDERNFAESLQLAVEDQFAVTIAGSLGQARTEISRSVPAAVLLDLRLPDGDGMELLRELNAAPQPPIIVVMTAHATVETFLSAMSLGAEEYVAKPLNIDKLKRELHRKLANNGPGKA